MVIASRPRTLPIHCHHDVVELLEVLLAELLEGSHALAELVLHDRIDLPLGDAELAGSPERMRGKRMPPPPV